MCRRPPPRSSSQTGSPAEKEAMTLVAKGVRSRLGDWLTLDLLQCLATRRGRSRQRLPDRKMLCRIQLARPLVHEELFNFNRQRANRVRKVLVNPSRQLAAKKLHILSHI